LKLAFLKKCGMINDEVIRLKTIHVPDGYKLGPFVEKQDKRLTIVITNSMRENIFNEAKEKDISLSAVVNKALKMYFNKK